MISFVSSLYKVKGILFLVGLGCLVAYTDAGSGAKVTDTGALGNLTRWQPFEPQRASSSHVELTKNGDAWPIEPGATIVLMDEKGPGIVTHFWNTVSASDIFYARSLVLRIYYDGLDKPSVEVPLGDFYGVGHGAERSFTSQPVVTSSNGRSRVCYWQMPFRESIRITVTNENQEQRVDSFYFYINWRKMFALSDDTMYFHAKYRQETPAKPGNYLLLETKGRGHYVGTVLSVLQMETGWFGEGDDFFYIDGGETPQLRGTGTEDYFNDSWGFREFSSPYHGVPLYEGVWTGDRVSAYRWHILDPIPFMQSLRAEIEHRGSIFDEDAPLISMEVGRFIERYDWISSVAFWYQYPPATWEDPFPPRSERIPASTYWRASELPYRASPPLLVVPIENALVYLPGINTGSIAFDLEIKEPGRYRIDGAFMSSLMGGVYQAYLNDKPLGTPYDFGAVGMDPIWIRLDTHDLKAGTATLRFKGIGQQSKFTRSLAPAQDGLAVIGFNVMRLDTLEGYRKALHMVQPK